MRTPEGYKYWKISVIPGYCCSSNLGNMKSQVNVVCLYETLQQSYCSSHGTKEAWSISKLSTNCRNFT